jgi:hypothetical protein
MKKHGYKIRCSLTGWTYLINQRLKDYLEGS